MEVEDFKPNRKGLYTVTFIKNEESTKEEIMKMLSKFGETPFIIILNDNRRVFANFKSKENAVKALTLKEFEVKLRNDKFLSENKPHPNPHHKGAGDFRKMKCNSIDDSDDKSCSSTTSAPSAINRRSYKNSSTSLADSMGDGPSPGLCEISANGENVKQNKNDHNHNRGKKSKELAAPVANSAPMNAHTNGSSDCNLESSDKPPILVNGEHQRLIGNSQAIESTVVVLSNLPPWSHAGHIFKLIVDATYLQPLEIEVVTTQKRSLLHYAYVHFKSLDDAEHCIKCLDNMWCENRRLICILVDELCIQSRGTQAA